MPPDPGLSLSIPPAVLKPLIAAVVREVLEQIQADAAAVAGGDRLCFSEAEAASMLGMTRWQLRDERLRGRIAGSRGPGRKIRYLKSDLVEYLASRRTEN